ncbi:homoserine O-acetyltransferase MetX [Salimicrobium flavidum]|uniref:Homoserine O-acetyltransferase n=1 Tax=Salimicrobium flavidum TaxID=570947 RepID=A0A1N7IU35_9BACI|nr:homoserine O-acetyltransferase [Salimicrobium flavidum]SIS40584.1 homoserine O-acetyltransferase [Salimicrobium flavidum]
MSVNRIQRCETSYEEISIGAFTFESGETLPEVTLAYEHFGNTGAPLLLICHALTGNQFTVGTEEEPGWWNGLFGTEGLIPEEEYQTITFNVLGGCHGSTGPASVNPETGESYRLDFPTVTIRDMVRAQKQALDALGISHIHAVLGGSLGGMQVYEWGLLYPEMMDNLFMLASTPFLSDYGIAFNHIGAEAIKRDPSWNGGDYESNEELNGFEIARMTGMVTYRSSSLFQQRFNRGQNEENYHIQSYLDYQGKKIKKRFDANSYLYLLEAMNHHDITRGRGTLEEAAEQYKADIYTISFEKDLVYPKELMEEFSLLPHHSTHYHVETEFGHDGFLVEFDKWGNYIKYHLSV